MRAKKSNVAVADFDAARAARAYRERDAGLRKAQEIAKLAYAVTLSDSLLESWPDSLPALIGVEPAQMPKSVREWLTLLHPDDRAKFRDSSIESGKRGIRFDIEYRLRRGDGAWIHLRHVIEPLADQTDAQGRTRWFNMVQDVTEPRRTAEELRERGERLRTIIEAEPECVKVVSGAGVLLEMNPAGLAMLEADSLAAVQAQTLIDFILPEHRNAFIDLHRRVIAGQSGTLEFEVVGLKGTRRWLETHAAPLRGANGGAAMLLGITRDITERKKAIQDLRESETRFRSLTELSADWYWEQDEEHRFVEFSGGDTIEGWGPDQKSAVGLCRWELPGASSLSGSWAEHKALVEAHLPFRNFEYMHIRVDGAKQYIAASGEPVFDAGGRFTGYRGVATNIAERKRAEQELQRFRVAMDASMDSIYLTDPSTMRFVYLNNTACERVGFSREQLLQMGPQDVMPMGRDEISREYEAVIAAGDEGLRHERRFIRSDGSEGWSELHRSAQRTESGTLIVTIGRDVTERKRAEDELQRFRAAMDVSGDAVVLVDRASMRYIDANRTMSEMTGYTRQEIIGMTPMDVFSADRQTLEREYDAIIADKNDGATKIEGQYRHRNGSLIPIETRRRALQTAEGWIIVGTARDITVRKAAEARINRLNRVYAVLSGINGAIVRIRGRQELLVEACRLAVAEGGYVMARVIGLDERGKASIAATSERDALPFVEVIDEFNRDPQTAQSLLAQVLRTGLAVVSNDVASDARVHNRSSLTADGTYGLAILPLKVESRLVGALVLRARAAGMFDGEEMRLLNELAGDLSFALDTIEKRERLDYLAFYDQLTGLANRTLFLERVNQSIRFAGQPGGKFALAILDIERLRTVNESLGRQAGDALLKQVTERLSAIGGPSGAGRVSADHFALVLGQVKGRSQASRVVNAALQGCFDEPFEVNGTVLRLAAKAGVALYPGDGLDADTLLDNAEPALRKAKDLGERHVLYTRALTERTARQLTLENQLRQGLERNEFVLYYQPKVDLETRSIVGVEALIRWQSPELGLVPPLKFIPLMEQTGLILPVGAWALKQAALDHRMWSGLGIKAPRVAVNVSPLQLRQRDFVSAVEDAILEGIAPTGIDLEITESLIMEDVQGSIEKLRAVRGLGVGVAIDDFGTGYSSLGYLAKLPVQTLKIDRSFIIAMLNDPDTMSLVQTIISLAHSLRLSVVAEGVEQEDQAKVLRLLRCDQMQGYLFSKPLPLQAITALLESTQEKLRQPVTLAG